MSLSGFEQVMERKNQSRSERRKGVIMNGKALSNIEIVLLYYSSRGLFRRAAVQIGPHEEDKNAIISPL
jgi:hypothetical protein